LGGIFDLCGYIGNLRLLAATRANASNNSSRMSKLIRLPGARSSVISNERKQARERMDRLKARLIEFDGKRGLARISPPGAKLVEESLLRAPAK